MQVDHGRGQVRMPEILLNEFQADARFEKMGCIAVTQGMRTNTSIVPIQLAHDGFNDTLHRGFAHGLGRKSGLFVVASFGGKDPKGVFMTRVVTSQDMQGGLRQRDEAIFGTFPTMDMD